MTKIASGVSSKTKLCCVIGSPVEHSLSPVLHNTGYDVLGLEKDFVFLAFNIKSENLAGAVSGIKAMNICGVSVTMPHKIAVMQYLDHIDIAAQKIGAVNTIVNKNGKLTGYNTDYLGILRPLEKLTELKNKKVLVLGASGAARAAIYAMKLANAKVTVANRTQEKAKSLAAEFDIKSVEWQAIENLSGFEIIINATSLGLNSGDKTPVPVNSLFTGQIIFDCIYNRKQTGLLLEAEKVNCRIVHGLEMFIEQGREQFVLYTGREVPAEDIRRKLNEILFG